MFDYTFVVNGWHTSLRKMISLVLFAVSLVPALWPLPLALSLPLKAPPMSPLLTLQTLQSVSRRVNNVASMHDVGKPATGLTLGAPQQAARSAILLVARCIGVMAKLFQAVGHAIMALAKRADAFQNDVDDAGCWLAGDGPREEERGEAQWSAEGPTAPK